MHECNAHFCVLSISSLTSWDVTVASSTDAAATQTSATASGSHRYEQLGRFVRGTAVICRQRRVAAGGGVGGEWPEGLGFGPKP
jgi:hypothetical protein